MNLGKRTLAISVAIVASALVALGCGSDDGTTTSADTSAAPTQGVATEATSIDMGEYYYEPKDAIVKAGSVTISADNIGQLPHELVLARTDADPSKLPTLPDGSVDEAKLEEQGRAPGEVEETLAGKLKSATIDLTAGRYVMYCNIPGHYAAGMYGTLTAEGSDSGTTTSTDTSAAQPPATTSADTSAAQPPKAKAITIDMGLAPDEYSYSPKDATAKAGSVTITAKNVGKLPHELVLARTDANPAKLPTTPDGSVDEAKLEEQGKAPGEVEETLAGKSRTETIDLPAGRYVMYCNIPGHYAAGMYGTLKTE